MTNPRPTFERALDLVTVVAFMVIIAAPWAAMSRNGEPDDYADESEKRAPARRPAWPRNVKEALKFPGRMDAFVQDHFGFRKTLIHAHSRLLYTVFNTSPSPKVVLGRNGWLFYNGDLQDGKPIADYRGADPLPASQLEWLRGMIQDQHAWLRDRDIAYLFVIVPTKEEVYSEFLPECITRVGPQTPREQLLEHLRAHDELPVLDLMPALLEAKSKRPVFDQTDTHWNSYGAFVATREIITALARSFPELRPDAEEDFEFLAMDGPGGDLAKMLNLSATMSERSATLVPRQPRRGHPEPVSKKDMCDIAGGVDNPALPSAIVYRDSFTEPLLPFLTEHFQRIRYVWARQGAKMDQAPDTMPDIVLQIMADRVFRLRVQYSPDLQREQRLKRGEIHSVELP